MDFTGIAQLISSVGFRLPAAFISFTPIQRKMRKCRDDRKTERYSRKQYKGTYQTMCQDR